MAVIIHPGTRLAIGDPDRIPLIPPLTLTGESDLASVLEALILSASGWRTVFAQDGDQESNSALIRPSHEVIVALAALVFTDYLKENCDRADPTVIVGMDTRPTGPAIADVMCRVFLAKGCKLHFAFIVAAPEIMAWARAAGALPEDARGKAHGFAYISASHNPIGHNGLKFGLTDGGVLSAAEAGRLIEAFKKKLSSTDRISEAAALVASADRRLLAGCYADATQWKREANSAYALFTREVVTGLGDLQEQEHVYDRIACGLAERKVSLVADLNGSARTLAIDTDVFSILGAGVDLMNPLPGRIAHRIVPEGESLDPCKRRLEELHATDASFVLGYVPDCDGDRGNIVVWDEEAKAARGLEAQEVFALCCVAELAHMVWTGALHYDQKGNALDKVAIAVNDPTSMRVDRIAAAFDVDIFRAEVGEANVVGLARRLRERGYKVRILGEGAAGGNITHPAAVRDPLATVFALLKLLTIRSDTEKCGLFELWCDLAGVPEAYHPEFSLSDIIATLPSFATTSAYENEAILKLKSNDQTLLKECYAGIFLADWKEREEDLRSRLGLASWEAIAYNGLDERRGIKNFGESGKGGLKILFADQAGHPRAYIWMRGSGTEPVMRIMADVTGPDRHTERELLAWQRSMVERADAALCTNR